MKIALFLYRLVFAVSVLIVVCVAPASAGDDAEDMEEIVVTAARTEVPKKEVPQVVDVITSEEIEATAGDTLSEQLKKNSSVDVIEYPGALSGISIRGFRPEFSGITKHSLLLIDGRPAGATNLATILMDNVERIEVLKGPASSLYGAEAMGGVINVITRKTTGPLSGSAELGGGSFDTNFEKLAAGGRLVDWLDFDLTLRNYTQVSDMKLGGGEGIRPGTSYRTRYGSLRLGSDLSPGWRLDIKGDLYRGIDIETPGALFYGDLQQSRKDIVRYGGDMQLKRVWGRNESRLTVFASKESSEYYKKYVYDYSVGSYVSAEPYRNYESTTRWLGVQIQNATHWRTHQFTLGADYQGIEEERKSYRQDGTRKAPYSPDDERENWAVFGDTSWRFLDNRLILNAGIRYDYFDVETKETPYKTDFYPASENFDTVNPRFGIKYLISSVLNLHSTLGKAFVPPNAYQMAGYSERIVGDTTMITRGNPDLGPEKSWTWDIGIGLDRNDWGLALDTTYFLTKVDDKITRKKEDNITTFENAVEARMEGLEVELNWDAGVFFKWDRSVSLFSNATRLFEATEKRPGEEEDDIHNVARWKVNYGISYDDGRINTRLLARYVGSRKDYDWYSPGYPEITYKGFTVVDLVAGIKFKRQHEVTLKVNNIFDEYYYEKPEFPLSGRAWYLSYKVSL